MPSLIDTKFDKLGTLGYTGTLSDRLYAWLKAESGATSGAMSDLWAALCDAQGVPAGALPDRKAQLWTGAGFTSEFDFWLNGSGSFGPSGPVWTPAELQTGSDLLAWWTMDDPATLYEDAAKTTNPTTQGDPVAVFADQEATRDFVQTGADSIKGFYDTSTGRNGVSLETGRYLDVSLGVNVKTHTWVASFTPKATNGIFGASYMNTQYNSSNRAYLSSDADLLDYGGSVIKNGTGYVGYGGNACPIGSVATLVKRCDAVTGYLDVLDIADGLGSVSAPAGEPFSYGATIRTGRNWANGGTTCEGVAHRFGHIDRFLTAGEQYRFRDWAHGIDFTVTAPFFVDNTTDTPGTQMTDHTPDTVNAPASAGPWAETGVNCIIDDAGTGVARDSGAGNDDYLYWDVGIADGIFSWDYVKRGSGLMWRHASTQQHWFAFIDDSGTLILYEENFGLWNRGSWAGGITPGAKLQVIHDGLNIKVFCDDILRIEYGSGSAHAGNTNFGCRYEGGSGTGSANTLSRGAKVVNSVLGRDLP